MGQGQEEEDICVTLLLLEVSGAVSVDRRVDCKVVRTLEEGRYKLFHRSGWD